MTSSQETDQAYSKTTAPGARMGPDSELILTVVCNLILVNANFASMVILLTSHTFRPRKWEHV